MDDMLLTPLVKKQRTAQGCCYASAAKAVRLLTTTRWSLSSSDTNCLMAKQRLFNDTILKDFQVILALDTQKFLKMILLLLYKLIFC